MFPSLPGGRAKPSETLLDSRRHRYVNHNAQIRLKNPSAAAFKDRKQVGPRQINRSPISRCLDAPRRTVLGRPVLPNGRELTTSTRMTLREQLREKISAAFYRHGLLCASYPVPIILFTSASILTCCYPLLRLPLPGTGPVEFTTGVQDYSVPSHEPLGDLERPDWYHGPPVAYIQQVLVKAAVSPWDSSLVPVDVFRSPLGKVFSLLEEIRNHVHSDGSGIRSLEALCLQVTDLFPGLRRMQSVLPEHGCLLVSPGNYWQNQRDLFDSDSDLLKTIQKHEPKGLHTSATLRGRNSADD